MNIIIEELNKILIKAGITQSVNFSVPPKPEMGDWAFPCFDLAKEMKKSPVEVSQDLVAKIQSSIIGQQSLVAKVQSFGPYVNFFLSSGAAAKLVLEQIKIQDKKYGHNLSGVKKQIVIEYPSNNTHKELHVGHLRNICMGNALVNLFNANGYQAVPINYLNDFGAHVAKCLWGLQKFHANEKPPRGEEQKWLGMIYAEASQYLEAHPDEKLAVYDLQKKIEARDRSVWSLYKKTRRWSIDKFNEVFKELNLHHRTTFYEQDVKEVGQKVVDSLLQNNIAQVGEGGAIIVDLQSYGLDIGLLRKSNGAGLYLTSDLGLAQAKHKKYPKIFESIHLTGSEQNFYFKQLFKILELAGFHFKMKHIGYGLVSLSSGKMSSRLGNVLLYEDLRNEVWEKLRLATAERHSDWSEKQIQTTAFQIALAAIKFEMLKHEAEKNVVFDTAAVASFDGFTGPYVLYTVARINSIIKKSKIKNPAANRQLQKSKIDFNLLNEPEERRLITLLSQYPEVIGKAFGNYNPSVVVKYCFDLAQAFNDFYAKHSVLSAVTQEQMAARLVLISRVRTVLENALKVLSIDTIKEM